MVWEVLQSKVVPIKYNKKARAIQVASSIEVWGASANAHMRVGRSVEVALEIRLSTPGPGEHLLEKH